jgi:hypothetical protein
MYSVSSTNKTDDHHDITEILLKVALSTIPSTLPLNVNIYLVFGGIARIFISTGTITLYLYSRTLEMT